MSFPVIKTTLKYLTNYSFLFPRIFFNAQVVHIIIGPPDSSQSVVSSASAAQTLRGGGVGIYLLQVGENPNLAEGLDIAGERKNIFSYGYNRLTDAIPTIVGRTRQGKNFNVIIHFANFGNFCRRF